MFARIASFLCLLALAAGAAAQKPKGTEPPAPAADPVQVADLTAFRAWLADYKTGAIRLAKEGKLDEQALADVDARMEKVARCNTLAAAQLLFEAASVEPKVAANAGANAAEIVDAHREQQPWRVQGLACKHLRTMTGEGIVPWLLQMLSAPGVRAQKQAVDHKNAAAVLRVLGGHPSVEAQLELMRAARSLTPELRVLAVNAMAKDPTLELLPTLLELLHDGEPNVRIAACNAIGSALQPHVDETAGKKPSAEMLATRDGANTRLEEVLVKDPIWQVRNAAAFALAGERCKAVIPLLIHGLDAELARKKDPWAMDVRLHKLLEGLTGQSVVRGSIEPWRTFWKNEGASLTVRAAGKTERGPNDDKYGKFFNLEVDSDRVLFVLDFSGSMAEPVTLKTQGTAASAGKTTTKAALVVQEMKRLIMSLPDGALVNLIVFSDSVRVWRQDNGRPALVKLDDAARDDLLSNFLDTLRPNGPTNLYDALDKALEFGGRGLHDKYYGAGFDTLYVITDGAPSAGSIVDKDEIRRRVRETNQLRRIAINCITFGDKNDTDFLGPLATENGGRHIHVD